jgi:hypothetical protein
MRRNSLVTFLPLVTLLALVAVGCSKKGDGDAPAGSSSATSATSGGTATPPRAPGAKLTHADLEGGYEIAKDRTIPYDKRLATLKAKLGEPGRTEGQKYYWQAKEKVCKELELEPNGASVGMVSDAKCK